jgi:hypothetical protein
VALRADAAEVSALLMVSFSDAVDVLSGAGGGRALARRLVRDEAGARLVEDSVSTSDFVPATDAYYRKACESLAVVLAGERPSAWILG